MGFFAGLDVDPYDRQYSDKYLFKRLGSYFQGLVDRVVGVSIAGLVVSLALALRKFAPVAKKRGK